MSLPTKLKTWPCGSMPYLTNYVWASQEKRYVLFKDQSKGRNEIEWSKSLVFTCSTKRRKKSKLSIRKNKKMCIRARKSVKGPLHSDLYFLLYLFPPQPLIPPGVFHLQTLKRAPLALKPNSIITPLTNSPCKLTLLSFQLASPPSIHMDSWWAACNSRQSPKWTQKTAQYRLRAYGHDPYGIWAPRSQKTTLHIRWPDEPVESDANQ